MSKFQLFLGGSILFLIASCNLSDPSGIKDFRPIKVAYPETPKAPSVVDTFFGTPIADPYRWLENSNSAAVRNWVVQEQQVAQNYLKKIPFRETIKNRLKQLWNYERYSSPIRVGNYFYALKNNGLQNQDILYRFQKLNDSTWTEVLNPNDFSGNGAIALGDFAFSNDGTLLAYETSNNGSDWRTIQVYDLESDRALLDTVRWVKFSNISWFRDGFYYSRFAMPNPDRALSASNEFHQVFYHRVGTPQSNDELVFTDRAHPKRIFRTQTTEDEHFLILSAAESSTGNALYFKDLNTNPIEFTPIVEDFRATFKVIGNNGNSLFVLTNYKAPKFRVIQINTVRPEERYWEEIIGESNDVTQEAHLFGGKLVVNYIRDASNRVRIFDLRGNLQQEIQLPGIGSVSDWRGKYSDKQAFFSFTSFTQPPAIYSLNLNDYTVNVFKMPTIQFDGEAYEMRQVHFKSYDGTEVPMFIIYKKGIKLDSNRPALLYGYGGFDVSILPAFNVTRLQLFPIVLENGGVCAVANIRGGGEFGESWHQAATKVNKSKSFDDFQAAAEYLIANNYTSSQKLAIYGRSNGGLLVGACLTQRPDLYRVAIPAVGVLDMLRYQRFTIGWAWAGEYGTVDNQKEFDALKYYSPVHNVKPAKYPATLIITADHDDRVVPAHSYKFAAVLQANQQADLPVLLRVDTNTGHGAGKSTAESIDEAADVLTFMFYNLKESINYK